MRWDVRVRAAAGAAVIALVVGVAGVAGASSALAEDPTTDPTPTDTVSPDPEPTTPDPPPTTSEPDPTTPPPDPPPTTSEPDPTTPPPTSTSTPKPTSTPTSTTSPPRLPTSPPGPAYDEKPPAAFAPLTGSFLASQIAAADRITAALNASTSKVAVQTREMDQLAARSNALLESLAAARETQRAALDEAAQARADLVVLDARLESSRALVREWVFSVYAGGGQESDFALMLEAMAAEPEAVGDPLGDVSYLTDERTRALDDVRTLTAEQVRLSAAAETAQTRARAATEKIASDSGALEKVLREQRARIKDLRELQFAEVQQAGPIASILVGARSPEARAAAARLRDALRAASADMSDIGKPCTNDTNTYPNGMYPPGALCPLWGAAGERLAPGAAAAFNAMSKAYASQSGVPLCVTDSYRSLPEQISIKGTRGRFAATPGTSRHGLGRALDLCGGVQDFSSPAHRWMLENGPLFGWFHPSWAAAGGSLPEPWHFEYAG